MKSSNFDADILAYKVKCGINTKEMLCDDYYPDPKTPKQVGLIINSAIRKGLIIKQSDEYGDNAYYVFMKFSEEFAIVAVEFAFEKGLFK